MSEPAPAPAPEPAPAPTPTPAPEPAPEPAVAADARVRPPPPRANPRAGERPRARRRHRRAAGRPGGGGARGRRRGRGRGRVGAPRARGGCEPRVPLPGHRSPRGFGFRLRGMLLGVLVAEQRARSVPCVRQVLPGSWDARRVHAARALEASHRVFLRLDDGRAYCLPDGYEIEDASLDDVRAWRSRRVSRPMARRTSVASSGAAVWTAPSISPARSA